MTEFGTASRFGRNLVVVDTPNIFDTNWTEKEILEEITKWYTLTSPGIHAILLILKGDRYTEEDDALLDLFKKIFGEGFKDFLIIVFTNKDQLDHYEITLGQFISTLEKSGPLRKLIDKCQGRCSAIGNFRGNTLDREREVKEILSMVDSLKDQASEKYFTNDMFKKTEDALRKEDEKFRSEYGIEGYVRDQTRNSIIEKGIIEEGIVFTAIKIVLSKTAEWLLMRFVDHMRRYLQD